MAKASAAQSLGQSAFARVMKETHQTPELRRHLIRLVEKAFSARVVTYFTSFSQRSVQITDHDVEMLESILSVEHSGGKILMILNSPGGQALAAERMVNVCRAYSNNQFEVLVPHMAKSAATMICFGASRIHMSRTAELGPVDPQVPYWIDRQSDDQEPEYISADEYVRSYDKLIASASSGKVRRLEPYIQQLSKYDARHIEQLRSLLNLSADISVRLLKESMMANVAPKAIRKSIDIFLSQSRTGSHGRMINHEGALRCGLDVKLVDLQSPTWHTIWDLCVRSNWSVSVGNTCGKIMETTKSSVSA
jgi:hypothetical protein